MSWACLGLYGELTPFGFGWGTLYLPMVPVALFLCAEGCSPLGVDNLCFGRGLW